MKDWHVRRAGLRYVVGRLMWADFAGSAYEFARDKGRVRRFWLRRSAEVYAAGRNAALARVQGEGA